jgi:hypothetical protein
MGFGVRTEVGKRFLFSIPVQIVPGTNPASCTMDPGDFTPGVNRPGREVDCLALSLGMSGVVPPWHGNGKMSYVYRRKHNVR